MPTKTRSPRSSARGPSSAKDPVSAYALAVTEGQIVAGRWVRLACLRHLRDLSAGAARGLVWRPDFADHAMAFFAQFLRLAEGQHAGQPFVLAPWQQFVVGSLFGWFSADGYR